MGRLWAALFFLMAILALAQAEDARSQPPLDKESMDCLSCHMESIPMHFCDMKGCDHPIGNIYEASALRNRGLRPAHSLPPFIRLVSGRIGCTTCHVPFSQQDHELFAELRRNYPAVPDPMLVTENRRSELCLACHVK